MIPRLPFTRQEATQLLASPDIDAVAIVVRVPSHYAPTKAALEAGKHVYCEWPLGRTTTEAVELLALAKTKRLVTAIGLPLMLRYGWRPWTVRSSQEGQP